MVDIRRTDAEKNGNISNVVIDEIEKVVKGKRDVITKVYAAILAGGHILLDDIPWCRKDHTCNGICESFGYEI